MKEFCWNKIKVEHIDPMVDTPLAPCKYKETCPKYKGFDPIGWSKSKDFEKCKYYQKFEKETT
jgi:hypothetical protein